MRTATPRKAVFLAACGLLMASHVGCSLFESDDSPRETMDGIPRDARIVREGKGELTYAAGADGTIYVQDLPDVRTHVTRRVRSGDRVRVTPDENRVRLDDRVISEDDLTRDHEHRIYFRPDRDERGRDRDDDNDDDERDEGRDR